MRDEVAHARGILRGTRLARAARFGSLARDDPAPVATRRVAACVRPRCVELDWGDPVISRRLLREHLDQAHDGASRRAPRRRRARPPPRCASSRRAPAEVLDAACGPGLYAVRLAAAGYRVTAARRRAGGGCARPHGWRASTLCRPRCRHTRRGPAPPRRRRQVRRARCSSTTCSRPSRDASRWMCCAAWRGPLRPGAPLVVEMRLRPDQAEGRISSWDVVDASLLSDRRHLLLVETVHDRAANTYVLRETAVFDDGTTAVQQTSSAFTRFDAIPTLFARAGLRVDAALRRLEPLSRHGAQRDRPGGGTAALSAEGRPALRRRPRRTEARPTIHQASATCDGSSAHAGASARPDPDRRRRRPQPRRQDHPVRGAPPRRRGHPPDGRDGAGHLDPRPRAGGAAPLDEHRRRRWLTSTGTATASTSSTSPASRTSPASLPPPSPRRTPRCSWSGAGGGVPVGAELAWEMVAARHLPALIVVNKMDKENAAYEATVDALREAFDRKPVAVAVPIGSAGDFTGYVDLVNDSAHQFEPAGRCATPTCPRRCAPRWSAPTARSSTPPPRPTTRSSRSTSAAPSSPTTRCAARCTPPRCGAPWCPSSARPRPMSAAPRWCSTPSCATCPAQPSRCTAATTPRARRWRSPATPTARWSPTSSRPSSTASARCRTSRCCAAPCAPTPTPTTCSRTSRSGSRSWPGRWARGWSTPPRWAPATSAR